MSDLELTVVELRVLTRKSSELGNELFLSDILDILTWAENWLGSSPYAAGTRGDTGDALNRVQWLRGQITKPT